MRRRPKQRTLQPPHLVPVGRPRVIGQRARRLSRPRRLWPYTEVRVTSCPPAALRGVYPGRSIDWLVA